MQETQQQIDPARLAPEQRQRWAKQYIVDRERGRTDLLWLCNQVLNYPDVAPSPHGPVIAHLQQFRGHEEYIDPKTLAIMFSEPRCGYHKAGDPTCEARCFGRSMWTLPGARWRMLLDPRGHFKTSVATIAHSIQWILNYPDVRIGLSVASFKPRGVEIITEIEDHFRYNETFRFFYPEFCPSRDTVKSWGTQDSFEVPNRKVYRNSPTVTLISIGNTSTGSHLDVIKNSDLVTEQNVKTDGGLSDTKAHFRHMIPLLERGPIVEGRDTTRGWMDMEGTIYNHSDLHSEQLEKDEERIRQGLPCRWSVLRRDAIVDEKNKITLFPQRFPWSELMETRSDMDEYTFNCQYRLNPHSRTTGLAERLILFPAEMRKELLPRYRLIKCTIDLASMEEDSSGCNTALCTAGHDRDGRKDILDAVVGRPNPFEVIEHIFRIDRVFSAGQRKVIFQIEKAHHAQVLLPFLEREQEKRKIHLNVVAIPRDSSVSKDNRIWGLQTWFKRGLIRFADDIESLPHIQKEVMNFPSYKFKDFVDALSDQLQTKDGGVDYEAVLPDAEKYEDNDIWRAYNLRGKFVGFDPMTKQPVYDFDQDQEAIFGSGYMTNNDSRVTSRMTQ